jgi:hypothetical protein
MAATSSVNVMMVTQQASASGNTKASKHQQACDDGARPTLPFCTPSLHVGARHLRVTPTSHTPDRQSRWMRQPLPSLHFFPVGELMFWHSPAVFVGEIGSEGSAQPPQSLSVSCTRESRRLALDKEVGGRHKAQLQNVSGLGARSPVRS